MHQSNPHENEPPLRNTLFVANSITFLTASSPCSFIRAFTCAFLRTPIPTISGKIEWLSVTDLFHSFPISSSVSFCAEVFSFSSSVGTILGDTVFVVTGDTIFSSFFVSHSISDANLCEFFSFSLCASSCSLFFLSVTSCSLFFMLLSFSSFLSLLSLFFLLLFHLSFFSFYCHFL